jgi:uncharacterized protein YwgA
MNRTIELLRVVQSWGRIDGRKKLQKIVHILKEAGAPLEFRYGFHFHGPFSAELKGDIDALVAEAILKEEEGATRVADYKQYSYSLGEAGAELLRQYAPGETPEWSGLAAELNGKSAQELEAVSTLLYLQRHGYEGEKLRQRFGELKPQLAAGYGVAEAMARRIGE